MKQLVCLILSFFLYATTNASVLELDNFADIQPLFAEKCAGCHQTYAKKPMSYKTLKKVAFMFDIVNGGRTQRLSPRMASARMTNDQIQWLNSWILVGAPDWNGVPTITYEQAAHLLGFN